MNKLTRKKRNDIFIREKNNIRTNPKVELRDLFKVTRELEDANLIIETIKNIENRVSKKYKLDIKCYNFKIGQDSGDFIQDVISVVAYLKASHFIKQ